MKKIIVLFLSAIIMSSCGTTVWQMKTDCNASPEELFKKIAVVLMQENFLIKANDIQLGYLQAESVPEFNPWLGEVTKYWVFQIQNYQSSPLTINKVTARAYIVYKMTNASGQVYFHDDSDPKTTWYWSVRNGLENICANKIVFIESKTQ